MITLAAVAACAILGLWVRYGYFAMFGGFAPTYTEWAIEHYFGGLSPGYLALGDLVLNGLWPTTAVQPVGYGVFVQGIRSVLGLDDLQAYRLFQCGFDAVAVFPLYAVVRWLGTGRAIGVFGAVIYGVHPLFAGGSTFILAESISPALLIWVLYLMTVGLARRAWWPWLLAGLVGSFATTCRPDFILFAPGACLLILLFHRGPVRKLAALAAYCVGFASLVGATGVMHRVNNGAWIFTTNAGSYAMYAGLGQVKSDEVEVHVNDQDLENYFIRRGIKWHSKETKKFFAERYSEIAKEHPGLVIDNILFRFDRILFSSERFNKDPGKMRALRQWTDVYGIWILLAALAAAYTRCRRLDRLAIMVVPLVYALGSIGLVYWEARYVRYAQLTYILGFVVLIDVMWTSGWRWLRGAHVLRVRHAGPPHSHVLLICGGIGALVGQVIGQDTEGTLLGGGAGLLAGAAAWPWPFRPERRRRAQRATARRVARSPVGPRPHVALGLGGALGAVAGQIAGGNTASALQGAGIGAVVGLTVWIVRVWRPLRVSGAGRETTCSLLGTATLFGGVCGAVLGQTSASASLGAGIGLETGVVLALMAWRRPNPRQRTRWRPLAYGLAGTAAVAVGGFVYAACGELAVKIHAARFVAAIESGEFSVAGAPLRFDDRWTVDYPETEITVGDDGALRIVTDDSTYSSQFGIELISIEAEWLLVQARLTIVTGGLSVKAYDGVTGNEIIARIAQGQGDYEIELVIPTFEFADVAFVVANYNPSGGRSEGVFHDLRLQPVNRSVE